MRILAEGVTVPLPAAGSLPNDPLPTTPFTDEQIRQTLPAPAPFGLRDCRCYARFAMA